MFVIAMIVAGMAFAALLGLIGAGLYISIMEPASPGEQQWQQRPEARKYTRVEAGPVGQTGGRPPPEKGASLTRVPHA